MKKLIPIIMALLMILSIGCSVPNDNNDETTSNAALEKDVTEAQTDATTEAATEASESLSTQVPTHTECTYCGEIKLIDDTGRWFIGTVMQSGRIRPLGNGCIEKVCAGTENIILHYDYVDHYYKDLKEEDLVRVVYSGEIMTSYPAQISAINVNRLNDDLTLKIANHFDCDYCGKLDNSYRWFIAEVNYSGMLVPIGKYCREAPGEIELRYSTVNGKEDKFMPEAVVLVVYTGGIIETYPTIIYASYVEYHGDLEKTVEAAKNIRSSIAYKELMEKVEAQTN